jgi:uncharacterized protein YecE (DUF72 family)
MPSSSATRAGSEVDEWGRRIAQWRRRAESYAYFNNDWNAYAVSNARRLADSLS